MSEGEPLVGGVSLSGAIAALRDELMHAIWAGSLPYEVDGTRRTMRFKPAPVEVTLEVAVTSAGSAKAGVKWWLIEAGGELSREKVATQTVKLTLEPMIFDETGQQLEVLIDAPESSAKRTRGDEGLADAPD